MPKKFDPSLYLPGYWVEHTPYTHKKYYSAFWFKQNDIVPGSVDGSPFKTARLAIERSKERLILAIVEYKDELTKELDSQLKQTLVKKPIKRNVKRKVLGDIRNLSELTKEERETTVLELMKG